MSSAKDANVIPLSPWKQSPVTEREASVQETAFCYTIDLLMEDFGKNHEADYCVLCEPMKMMGLHRDQVIERLNYTLFTTFFPNFEEYLLEIKETMVQRLISRNRNHNFSSWQEKLQVLLKIQIQKDLQGFLEDIIKHLQKYGGGSLSKERQELVLSRNLKQLQSEWIPEKFGH